MRSFSSRGVLEMLGGTFCPSIVDAYDCSQMGFKRNAFTYDGSRCVLLCSKGKGGVYSGDSGLFGKYWANRKDCDVCPVQKSACANQVGKMPES